MPVQEWTPGVVPPDPIYIDASIIAASFVRKDKRYGNATQLFGDLFASDAEIVLSPLTLSETTWALAKMSWCELHNQPFHKGFNQGTYRKWHEDIFGSYRGRLGAVEQWMRDWRSVGINVSVFPKNVDGLQDLSRMMPLYMEQFKLASADALHLAAAELGARSLVTGDDDFNAAQASPVEIFYVPKD